MEYLDHFVIMYDYIPNSISSLEYSNNKNDNYILKEEKEYITKKGLYDNGN